MDVDEAEDVNEMVAAFNQKIQSALDRVAPVKLAKFKHDSLQTTGKKNFLDSMINDK